MKLRFILIILLAVNFKPVNAQINNFAVELNKQFNTIFNEIPNEYCKKLYGNSRNSGTNTYNSTVELPQSVHNRFDLAPAYGYPMIFMSYLPAGNNLADAAAQLKNIGKVIENMVINFHDKDYKILFSAKDSKDGERPDFKYRLENPPAELANAQIYIRIDEAGEPVNLSQNKWQFTLGIMVKK